MSVRLALDIGIDRLRDYLRIFGFPTDFPRNLSLALGSSEVTLLELTRAYGVFATLGTALRAGLRHRGDGSEREARSTFPARVRASSR